MECTGERYMPEVDGDWTLEHVHRYLLTCELARGKVVLDIASGEGYGTYMLAEVARAVTGVDISTEAVERASQKYIRENLFFVQGSATAIPLADHCVDLVTSFETIEHLAEQEQMLEEILRVLRPGGLLIMSSPDKKEYTDIPDFHNEYHVRELYRHEFESLLRTHFAYVKMLGQRISFGSVLAAEEASEFLSWRKNEPDSRTVGLSQAEYLIAVAANCPLPVLPSSILKHSVDQSDVMRTLESWAVEARAHIKGLEAKCVEQERNYAHLEDLYFQKERERVQVHEQHSQLNEKYVQLQAQYADIHAYCAEQVAKGRSLEKYTAELQCAIHELVSSRSWKLTAPLRATMAVVRRWRARNSSDRQMGIAEGTPALRPVWPPDVRGLEIPIVLDPTPPLQTLPSIGAFMHIYYADIVDEMLFCLRCLPPVALHVSTDTEEKRNLLAKRFSAEGLHADIRVCPNQGWDVAPFLVGFADAIPQYDLIFRLHSKRSLHIPGQTGEEWRRMIYHSLAGSPDRVNAIIAAFEANPRLGMVCPPILSYYADSVHFGGNFKQMRQLLMPFGVDIKPGTVIDFPMGTMFWCRPAVLAPWLEQNFRYEDFAPTSADERDSSLAHALERLLFFGCGIRGYQWSRLPAAE